VACWQEFFLVTAVPFAYYFGGIPCVFEQPRDGDLVRIQPQRLSWKKDPSAVKGAEADTWRIATGEHGATGRGANRRGHVKICEAQAFRGHFIKRGRFIDGRSVTA